MAYDEKLAGRVRSALKIKSTLQLEEKQMMGGLTFMVNGKMCLGILKEDLMARIDPIEYESALQKKGCRQMDFTGKPVKGYVFIGVSGTSNKKDLDFWIGLAL